jgi:uncharacterized membrane protein
MFIVALDTLEERFINHASFAFVGRAYAESFLDPPLDLLALQLSVLTSMTVFNQKYILVASSIGIFCFLTEFPYPSDVQAYRMLPFV